MLHRDCEGKWRIFNPRRPGIPHYWFYMTIDHLAAEALNNLQEGIQREDSDNVEVEEDELGEAAEPVTEEGARSSTQDPTFSVLSRRRGCDTILSASISANILSSNSKCLNRPKQSFSDLLNILHPRTLCVSRCSDALKPSSLQICPILRNRTSGSSAKGSSV